MAFLALYRDGGGGGGVPNDLQLNAAVGDLLHFKCSAGGGIRDTGSIL